MDDYDTDYGDPYIEWNEENDYVDDVPEPDIDEQFEWESSMASAGWGTDEDYGYFGGDEY